MKRSISPDFSNEAKRFDTFATPSHFQQQNQQQKMRIPTNLQIIPRQPMQTFSNGYWRFKGWVREDAEAALALEKEYSKASKRQMLILYLPDPDPDLIKKFSPFIEAVHFQEPSTPHCCFVELKEGADTVKVLQTIREQSNPFGTGKIIAELKTQASEDPVVAPKTQLSEMSPEEIDPYTLYIGNLPVSISMNSMKMQFPNAHRIDIGFPQRFKFSRYAFIWYSTVDEAMKAYKNTVLNSLLESRSLIVRFRRQKSNIMPPGGPKMKLPPQPVDRATIQSTAGVYSEKNEQQAATLQAPSTLNTAMNLIASASGELQEEKLDTKDDVLEKDNELLKTTTLAVAAGSPNSEAPNCIRRDPPEKQG